MGQIGTLIRWRFRRFANRVGGPRGTVRVRSLRNGQPGQPEEIGPERLHPQDGGAIKPSKIANRDSQLTALRIILVLCGVAVLPVAGFALSPDSFGPVRVRAGLIHWGGWSLETAFYLACLVATLQSYRLLESLFRHREARILAVYPIRLGGLFFYRLGSALLDTLVITAGCALFLLPVWFKGAAMDYLWSLVLLLLSALIVVAVGFAAQMAAGVADYRHLPDFFRQLDRQSGGTGGAAAAYLFSPAIALACSLALILFSKLVLEEIIKAVQPDQVGGMSGIVPPALGILVVAIVGSLGWAYRNFTRHYPLLFARFFEADLIVLDTGVDYFARDRRPARGWEARLTGPVRSLYRLDRLQLARRSPLAKIMVVLGPLAGLITFLGWGRQLLPWMVIAIGLLWVLVLANPWARLFDPALEPGMGLVLPISDSQRRKAREYLVVREIALLTLPLCLCALTLPTWQARLSMWVVPLLALSLVEVLTRIAEGSHRAPRLLGFLVAAFFAALSGLWSVGPFLAVVPIALASILAGRSHPEPRGGEGKAVAG
ncbi:MAG: hypothetical protein JW797_13465 [Bradymonadales bacterium]|nr:hypothetical protein [Bradymonadales bacterium]